MALTFEAAERLFNRGEFDQIRQRLKVPDNGASDRDPRYGLLAAHAHALTGDFPLAARVASEVEPLATTAPLRAQYHIVLGLIAEGRGEMRHSLEQFQAGLRSALLTRDDLLIAWSYLRVFRHRVDTEPSTLVMAMLPDVRRATMRAGDQHATAFLHQCVTILEGQVGRFDEARRHCDIVDSLLLTAPNAWLRAGNLMNRACLALLSCDFTKAAKHLLDAHGDLLKSGSRGSAADSNLGHCQVLTGQFQKGLATLNRVLSSHRASRFSVLAALEGLARLHLSLGNLSECALILRRIDTDAAQSESLATCYHVRWSAITKARFLLKSEDPTAALTVLQKAERRYTHLGDRPLAAALNLTMAQAFALAGDARQATKRLTAATCARIADIPELQAATYFAASLIVADAVPLAENLRSRAVRLWKHQGVESVQREMSIELTDRFKVQQPAMASRETAIVDCAAALMDLAATPKLMGAEVLSLLRATRCSENAVIRETEGTEDSTATEALSIRLGGIGGRQYEVRCRIPDDPVAAVAISAVARLAEAAVSLHRAREQERNRAALWPADAVEEQAGALFVAEEMKTLLATARRVAPTTVPVLITGETGTGKEVLARTIHAYSTRAKATFAAFNCTSTPRDMLDSQLFGHRRGAFTGALEHFPGVIRAAAGGTLFLDEIGDMPLDVQPKLLRFLEAGEVHPLGETQPVRADVRVIAATNASLDTLVGEGRFREDLFYRLNIVRLHIPPLRERRVEIPSLANHYLHKYAIECGKGELRLAEETMEYLVLYRWPGNVRQLANEMRRMAALCEAGAVLMPEHLSPEIAASRLTIPASERVLDPTEIVVRLDQPMSAATDHLHRAMVRYALKQCHGRMEETAAMLGLSRKGLYLKRQRFGLDVPGGAVLGSV